MPTIFVSANDTCVGKTWVTATLARMLASRGFEVQVIKAVETGVSDGESGDAAFVLKSLSNDETLSGRVVCRTLMHFTEPLAPVEAALRDGAELCFDALVDSVKALPQVEWRIIEGAGGLGVPLESGKAPRDWADFAEAVAADYAVLVIEDRLGAIHQARMLAHYATARSLNAGWWLNQVSPDVPASVRATNEKTLRELAFPLWGIQEFEKTLPSKVSAAWLS
ncbi:dethiobiotin synthase [Rubellicoccus peritrichatus]|uniref:ATP-dependent dethiobiotin synthetase BioD n=1 Tax=Rubellicoccus peritrichatus TaxID=3080537 RepID=A0AAQ3QWF5_9BACT|nr:dethiobiotin synthase [Puniceicoccus sp. CR14]WOO41820.1 dethiobiotin synthase [Puniceicoccus sp. CR14]